MSALESPIFLFHHHPFSLVFAKPLAAQLLKFKPHQTATMHHTGLSGSLLTAVVLLARHVAATPTGQDFDSSQQGQIQTDQDNGPIPAEVNLDAATKYRPSGFRPDYDSSYCPKGSYSLFVPPVVAFYPFTPAEVYAWVGNYYNISWISDDLTVSFDHNVPSNIVGEIRNQTDDPFAASEVLTYYYNQTTDPYGFFYQQGAKTASPMKQNISLFEDPQHPLPQGSQYIEVDSRLGVNLVPACGGKATQFGFYNTFCMTGGTKQMNQGLMQGVSAASAKSLKHLLGKLTGGDVSQFNQTIDCQTLGYYTS